MTSHHVSKWIRTSVFDSSLKTRSYASYGNCTVFMTQDVIASNICSRVQSCQPCLGEHNDIMYKFSRIFHGFPSLSSRVRGFKNISTLGKNDTLRSVKKVITPSMNIQESSLHNAANISYIISIQNCACGLTPVIYQCRFRQI